MRYTYPLGQTPKAGAYFVMAADFDSGKYDEYAIPENGTDIVHIFKHSVIAEHLKRNPSDRDRRIGFANGKQFIRLRTNLEHHDN